MEENEYLGQDGLGLGRLIADGEVSKDEALHAARRRAERINPHINAIVRDIEPVDSPGSSDGQGAFAGVPFLIKDLGQDYAGLPSSCGSRALARFPMPEHSTVVKRWLDGGLQIFGKTNTPEFGAKGVTEPELFGPSRNPWDTERTPGGSSGGSAAAVAAGIVPVAGASDGGGSIRIPAGCCGLFGLKAGRGLIPAGPAFGELLQGSATNGVVSRSVRDSAAMLDLLSGPEQWSPYLPALPEGSFLDEVGRDPGRLRIGLITSSAINPSPDPAAAEAVDQAAKLLESLGHEVEPAETPYDDRAMSLDFLTTWFVTVASQVELAKLATGARDRDFEQDTRIMAVLGRATGGLSHNQALERRHFYVRALAGFHERYDLMLTPTMAREPVRIGELDKPRALRLGADLLLRTRTARLLSRTSIPEQTIEANLGWVPYTQLANITGRPAASIPLHWTGGGLPLGVQFVAPLGGEGLLLRLAAQLEEARPWADRRPQAELA